MARREVLFAFYKGESGGPCGIVLSAFTLANEVLLIVQLPEFFEIWTLQNILGRNYTFRNRAQNGLRQPLELLIMSWLQSDTGDLCLLPEYIDTITAPIGFVTKEEFLHMWKTSESMATSDTLRERMLIWMFQNYTFTPLSTEVAVVTPQSFTNLREQFQQICNTCNDCACACMTMCVKDPKFHHRHSMCSQHLFIYLESHILLLKGALAVQPTYQPQYVLCPWCAAIVDPTTLLSIDVSNVAYVSLVIQLCSMLEKKQDQ
jgi:hypothetical protein